MIQQLSSCVIVDPRFVRIAPYAHNARDLFYVRYAL
jgi:hypothetical protein